MFRKREMRVSLEKKSKQPPVEPTKNEKTFEQKTDYVVKKLGEVVVKVGIAVGVYVLLDTYRQVTIAKNTYPHSDE